MVHPAPHHRTFWYIPLLLLSLVGPVSTPAAAPVITLAHTTSLPAALGDPLPENVLKLFDAVGDSTRHRMYVAGIMTQGIAAYDTQSGQFTSVLPSGYGGAQNVYKYLLHAPSIDSLFVESGNATPNHITRVDLATATVAATSGGLTGFLFEPVFDSARNLLYVTSGDSPAFTVLDGHDLTVSSTSTVVDGHAGPAVYDAGLDRVFILDLNQYTGTGAIRRLDPATNTIESTIAYAMPVGTQRPVALLYDPAGARFFVQLSRTVLELSSSGTTLKSFSVPTGYAMEDVVYDPVNQKLVMLATAIASGGQVANRGSHLFTFNANPGSSAVVDDIALGEKCHRLSWIAETSHIVSPEGDGSVVWTVPTSPYGAAQRIRLGYSADQTLLHPVDGSLLGTSRLGASLLYRLTDAPTAVTTFQSGYWPIPIRAGFLAGQPRLAVLNAWDSTLALFSAPAGTVPSPLGSPIATGLVRGSTDRLPDLAVDWESGVAAAAYPEFGTIALVSLSTGAAITTLTVPGITTGDTGGGPGDLQVLFNHGAGILYAFDLQQRKLHLFQSTSPFTLLGSVSLGSLPWGSRMNSAGNSDWLFLDEAAGRLWVGPFYVNPATGASSGASAALPEGQKIFGLDSSNSLYWVSSASGTTRSFLAVDRNTLATLASQDVPNQSQVVGPTFCLDATGHRIIVSEMTAATIREYQYTLPASGVDGWVIY